MFNVHAVLATLLSVYVDQINSNGVPSVENAVDTMAQQQNTRAKELAVSGYLQKMKNDLVFPDVDDSKISQCHNKCLQEAITDFLQNSIFDENHTYQREMNVNEMKIYQNFIFFYILMLILQNDWNIATELVRLYVRLWTYMWIYVFVCMSMRMNVFAYMSPRAICTTIALWFSITRQWSTRQWVLNINISSLKYQYNVLMWHNQLAISALPKRLVQPPLILLC